MVVDGGNPVQLYEVVLAPTFAWVTVRLSWMVNPCSLVELSDHCRRMVLVLVSIPQAVKLDGAVGGAPVVGGDGVVVVGGGGDVVVVQM